MVSRCPTQGQERILQPSRQGDVALATQDDMGMLEAGPEQAEVVEPMIERAASDRHAQVAHLREVREVQSAGLTRLAKDHLPFPRHEPPARRGSAAPGSAAPRG